MIIYCGSVLFFYLDSTILKCQFLEYLLFVYSLCQLEWSIPTWSCLLTSFTMVRSECPQKNSPLLWHWSSNWKSEVSQMLSNSSMTRHNTHNIINKIFQKKKSKKSFQVSIQPAITIWTIILSWVLPPLQYLWRLQMLI